MILGLRAIAGIAAAASLLIARASAGSETVYNGVGNNEGVAINSDGTIITDKGLKDITKSDFLGYLETKDSILIGFYQEGKKEVQEKFKQFETFAAEAAAKYPDMQLGKANTKTSPYLTARLLLTEIPQLRLLIKSEGGKWSVYSPEIADGSEALLDYFDNQGWLDEVPVGGKAQLYCSPFNMCGKTLALIADKLNALEDLIPLPKWMVMILLPALVTFVGRFIIEGMYAAEAHIRDAYRSLRGLPAEPEASDESEYEDDDDDDDDNDNGDNDDNGADKKEKDASNKGAASARSKDQAKKPKETKKSR